MATTKPGRCTSRPARGHRAGRSFDSNTVAARSAASAQFAERHFRSPHLSAVWCGRRRTVASRTSTRFMDFFPPSGCNVVWVTLNHSSILERKVFRGWPTNRRKRRGARASPAQAHHRRRARTPVHGRFRGRRRAQTADGQAFLTARVLLLAAGTSCCGAVPELASMSSPWSTRPSAPRTRARQRLTALVETFARRACCPADGGSLLFEPVNLLVEAEREVPPPVPRAHRRNPRAGHRRRDPARPRSRGFGPRHHRRHRRGPHGPPVPRAIRGGPRNTHRQHRHFLHPSSCIRAVGVSA